MSKLETKEDLEPAIESYGKFYKIHEMFESFSGWYWFTTVKQPYPEDPHIRYGFVVGFEKEWGTFDVLELQESSPKVWPVPKRNWSSNSNVTLVPKSRVTDMTNENGDD